MNRSIAAPSVTRKVLTVLMFPRTTASLRNLLRDHLNLRVFLHVLGWWAAAVVALAAYVPARSNADNLGLPVHGSGMETFLFGSLPTVWLQDHVYSMSPSVLGWAADLVHVSWFFVPLLAAVLVSLRRPQRIGSFFRWWFAVQAIGVVFFALFPTRPPWMVSDDVTRVLAIHFSRAADDPNALAAMPSLHVAFPLVISVWFFRERWKAPAFVMLGYSVLLAFEVVFSGEHYVVDILGSLAVAAVIFLASRIHYAEVFRSLMGRARASATAPALQAIRPAKQGERGQAVIEFALLFPIFILFLLIMVDFGIAMDHRLVMQHAVSEGVREAAVSSDLTDIKSTTVGQSQGLVTATDVHVCYIDGADPGNSLGDVTDKVQVSALYHFDLGGEMLTAFGVSPPAIDMEPVYAAALQVPVTGANACP
jgi:hypothetical protein